MITDKHQMDILQEYVLQFKKMKKWCVSNETGSFNMAMLKWRFVGGEDRKGWHIHRKKEANLHNKTK
jgi:hypothetical protein